MMELLLHVFIKISYFVLNLNILNFLYREPKIPFLIGWILQFQVGLEDRNGD